MKVEEGLLDVIGALAGGRVFPRLPQPVEFPCIRYTRISTTRRLTIDAQNAGVTEVTFQVDCMAESYLEAKTLADEVRVLLHTYRGAWGDLTAQLVHLQGENDFAEQDGDRITHWVSQRYQVWTEAD